jgi:hypothetical protein
MKVFLTTAYNYTLCIPSEWLIAHNTYKDLVFTTDAELADVIIFVESHPMNDPYFRRVINHNIYKKYPHKCVLYHDADLSITPIPTISPSIEAWQYNPKHKRTFHYIARVSENETINQSTITYDDSYKYLYSFIGSRTHAVRNKLMDIAHPANAFIKDTSASRSWELNDVERSRYEYEYMDVMRNSYFVLCPRGIGPCSYRLFETMQLGRVPVIISDAWVDIPDVDWNKFSIKIPESQIHLLASILETRKGEAQQMGKTARQYWENYFSPEVSLVQLVNAASDLLKHKYSFKDSIDDYSQFFREPSHIKNFLRYWKNRYKRIFKMFR